MKRILIIIPVLFLLSFSVWFYNNVLSLKAQDYEIYTYDVAKYRVLLEGEVTFPNRYEVLEGTTLSQLIDFAGGFTPYALIEEVDLMQIINEDKTITISRINEEKKNLVNINYATFAQLLTIPGITEKRAASIILYREQNGLFKSVNELLNVKNIGPSTLEKIKEFVTV
jgi:competence protein ComEA